MQDSPVVRIVRLPTDIQIFDTLFSEFGTTIKPTAGTKIANQVLSLFGGTTEIGIMCSKEIIDLLVAMTPKRIERIVKELKQGAETGRSEEELITILSDNLNNAFMRSNDISLSLDRMSEKAHVQKATRDEFYQKIQRLYDAGILLRGKSFQCPHCGTNLWFSLDAIQASNKCYACNIDVQIPVHHEGKVAGDAFRLNELICNAVDQGILPLLLALHQLQAQPYNGKRFICNYNVYSEQGSEIGEVDLAFTLGGRLGLAEIKAHRGFDNAQVDRLINVSKQVKADMLLFGTLLNKATPEINDLIEHLKTHQLSIPAFITGADVLLNNQRCDLYKYFERTSSKNSFEVGPILLKPSSS